MSSEGQRRPLTKVPWQGRWREPSCQWDSTSTHILSTECAGSPSRKKGIQPRFCCSDDFQMLSHFLGAANINESHFQPPLSHSGYLTSGCKRCSMPFALAAGLSYALLSYFSCYFAIHTCAPLYFALTHLYETTAPQIATKGEQAAPQTHSFSPAWEQGTLWGAQSVDESHFPPLHSSRGLNYTQASFTGASQLRKTWMKTSESSPMHACCAGSLGQRCPLAVPGDQLQGHQLV